jgi:alcohol dehydrogenase class IV
MTMFEFFSVPRIVFGQGQFARIGELAAELGQKGQKGKKVKKVLAILSPSAVAGGGRLEAMREHLKAAGVGLVEIFQRGEPTVADVDAAVALGRREDCQGVIGLGGGSALDAAKAAAALLTNGGSALDYLEVVGGGKKITRPAAPWLAVPTTAGTGAEVTRNAVITGPEPRLKASIRSEHLLPRLAVVDPLLTVDVPPAVTAASGMDALCQLIESYTAKGANPMTDALALEGINLAAAHLRRAYKDGCDLEAREGMSLAALFSGIALTNAGLGAVHGIAPAVGANFPIPHGVACAVLLPPVMAANVAGLRTESADHPVLKRYAVIGRALTGQISLSDDQAIEGGIAFVRKLVGDLHTPQLSQFGLTASDIPAMVALASRSNSMRSNPVKLPEPVLADILAKVL